MPRDEQGRRPVVYGKSAREVRDRLRERIQATRQGLPVLDERVRVGDWLEWWLREVAASSVRPSTFESYESHVRIHLRPALGRVRLARLSPQHVVELQNRLLASGLSPATVTRIRATLRRAVAIAERYGLVHRNVVALVDAPRVPNEEPQALTVEELGRVLKAASSERLGPVIVVGVYTGLRLGELLGLFWEDVDFDTATVTVTRTLQRIPREGLVLGEPKSKTGRRSVPLPEPAAVSLREWRTIQAKDRLRRGKRWAESRFVFTSSLGTPVEPRVVQNAWYRILQEAGLPLQGMHVLRRTYASLLAAGGTHPRTAQRLLGHSTPMLTLQAYTAATEDGLRDAVRRISEALDG